ncbi:unnamed protein product [Ascophyllum nodosum]
MCPGETKALHLYEARFLALFEEAIRIHGGCVGGAIFVEDGVLVKVGHLCDIIAWEKEEVGVSVAVRCVGRVEIADVISIDPYIRASVREVQDTVGDGHRDDEDANGVVSSDVFSLHRQCMELEGKVAASGGGKKRWARNNASDSSESPSARRRRAGRSKSGGDSDDPDELFGSAQARANGGADGAAVEKRDPEADDLMTRFQRGGGELDMSEVAEARESEEMGAEGDESFQGGEEGFSFDADADDNEDEKKDDEEGNRGGGTGKRSLKGLLWGHETRSSGEGFGISLEEQVEAMHDSLKADLGVSLDEPRGGLDASRFGAALGKDNYGKSTSSWGEAKTMAELIVASGGDLSRFAGESEDKAETSAADGEEFLWGCSSKEEEHDQLVSYVSLGCFEPSARIQSLMITSTGQRLRLARDALAERLKVLVAKSALSQLGD